MVRRTRRLRAEIEMIFTTAASWNDNSKARQQGAAPIDPDPDGQMRRIADGLDRTLAAEGDGPDHAAEGACENCDREIADDDGEASYVEDLPLCGECMSELYPSGHCENCNQPISDGDKHTTSDGVDLCGQCFRGLFSDVDSSGGQ